MTQKTPYCSLQLKRDHARPRQPPAVSNAAVEARLSELVSPSTDPLAHAYHDRGPRTRLLNLPIMLALVLALTPIRIPVPYTSSRSFSANCNRNRSSSSSSRSPLNSSTRWSR